MAEGKRGKIKQRKAICHLMAAGKQKKGGGAYSPQISFNGTTPVT
jgi:hypothetical protein